MQCTRCRPLGVPRTGALTTATPGSRASGLHPEASQPPQLNSSDEVSTQVSKQLVRPLRQRYRRCRRSRRFQPSRSWSWSSSKCWSRLRFRPSRSSWSSSRSWWRRSSPWATADGLAGRRRSARRAAATDDRTRSCSVESSAARAACRRLRRRTPLEDGVVPLPTAPVG